NIETILNVSIDDNDPRYVPQVLRDDSLLVRVKKNNNGDWIVPNVRPSAAVTQATPGSGKNGNAIDQNSFTGQGKEAAKAGLFALEKADLFNLLCIPPYKDDSNVDATLVGAAAAYCEKKRAMLLVDPLEAWDTVAEVIAGLPNIGTTSKNSAFFLPRLR